MFLVQLIYASRVSSGFGGGDVQEILDISRKNNADRHVTGTLLFDRNYFLQCLEGGRTVVNRLYHTILNDPRHDEVLLLQYSEIALRDFGDWHMGYVGLTAANRSKIINHASEAEFNPFQMSGASALGLLIDMNQSQEDS